MPACAALLAVSMFVAHSSPAAQPELVSSPEMMMAGSSVGGFSIVPADDVALPIYSEDSTLPQAFEIIRPDMRAFSVGRLGTSCSCIRASLAKKSYAQGERAIIEVRNIKPAPVDNSMYAVFAQLTSPYREALQADVYISSSARPPVRQSAVPERSAPVPSGPAGTGAAQPGRNAAPQPPSYSYDDLKPYMPVARQPEAANL